MPESGVALVPAPPGRRLGAVALDYLLISAYLVVLVLVGVALSANAGLAEALFGSPLVGELVGFAVLTLPVVAYFVVSEASSRGATLGKARLGLRVVTVDGRRLGLGGSLVRSGVKFLPWELAHAAIWQYTVGSGDLLLPNLLLAACWLLVAVNVGLAAFGDRHRALHDRIAGSLVVRATSR
jgi:uncharacterized RDD family membrane protein YckC